jgi:hypothetical protein
VGFTYFVMLNMYYNVESVQEFRENDFILNDTTGSAHIITQDVPAGCPKPSIGKISINAFSIILVSLLHVDWFK